MDSESTLRFRWNDHVLHLSKAFSEQRVEEQYCNVSLVSEDGYIIKAHSIILCMTSVYFEHILQNVTPDQHPIIVLHGVNYSELSCIIDYIYFGITRVDEHLMESVLDLADMLEIKGLSKMKNNISVKKLIAPSNPHSISAHTQSNPKTNTSISSFSEDSNKCTMKVDSDHNERINIEKDRKEYETSQERNNSCMRDLTKRLNQSNENLDDSQKSENVDLDEETENSMDQTLGIDLSLSKSGSSVLLNKDFGKNFNLHEDDLGKKNNGDENFASSKQKTVVKSLDKITKSSEFTLEKLANMLSKDKIDNGDSSDKIFPNIFTSCHKKEPLSMSVINDENSNNSEVEVSCCDGGLTISVTTGTDPKNFSDPFKVNGNRNCPQVSLSLRKSKKKIRTKKEIEDTKKKWLAKERRNLLHSYLIRRPNTRSLVKQKVAAEDDSSESVSINCDPPFPTDDTNQKMNHCIFDLKKKELCVVAKENTDNIIGSSQTEFIKKIENKETFEGSKRKNSISPLTLFTLPPSKDKEKQKRTSLTLERKIKVIEAFLDGKSQRQIAKMYGIGKTQVNGIVKKREEILSLYRENLVSGEKLTMKRQRKSEYAILNEHLIKWYRHMTIVAGIKITTGMLRAKALQIAPDLGCHDFKGSNGWLATFKSNNNLKFSKSKLKAKTDNDLNQNFEVESANNEDDDTEFFDEEGDDGHINNLSGSSHGNPDSSGEVSAIHLGPSRSELHNEVGASSTSQPGSSSIGGIGNISLGNSILSSSSLPKLPQMSNTALGSNLAYNLTRDHSRSEMARGEVSHLSDLHSSNVVNPSSSLTHSALSKPDAALSYKSEDSISYGYDPQARMNESSTRGAAEYNYTHYGFPSTYYGYHFLGQY